MLRGSLAHASTGTAIAALHGAAATNAGWAWFGGGSLIAGGGGMAAGHLILPGIGTAVAVAVSSTISHKEANKIAAECRKIEEANRANSLALSKLRSDIFAVEKLDRKLREEGEILSEIVRSTRKKLFRFGLVSHYWRLLRFWISGYYYTREELPVIQHLHSAYSHFVEAFAKS